LRASPTAASLQGRCKAISPEVCRTRRRSVRTAIRERVASRE
jgi:hypothetical protein